MILERYNVILFQVFLRKNVKAGVGVPNKSEVCVCVCVRVCVHVCVLCVCASEGGGVGVVRLRSFFKETYVGGSLFGDLRVICEN